MQLLNLLLLLWFGFFPFSESTLDDENDPGNRIALSFIQSDSFTLTDEQAGLARDIGIFLLEVKEPSQFTNRAEEGFYFLLDIPLAFKTSYQFTNTNRIVETIFEQFRDSEIQNSSIAAVSLFRYPDDRTEEFARTVSVITDTLQNRLNKPLYYQSAFRQVQIIPEGIGFVSLTFFPGDNLPEPVNPVISFQPSGSASASLQSLEYLLNRLHQLDDSIAILPADWFFERLEAQPELALLFSDHIRGMEVTFPLPADEASIPDANWCVIFLFLIWGSFVILYRYQPMYPSMILRYLTNHSFFVADIMENRLRTITPGSVILVQHSVMAGLMLFATASYFLSTNGAAAFADSFPYLMILPSVTFSLFLFGVITGLLFHLTSLFWIYFLNKSIKNPIQVINLYSWPLAINLVVLTLLIFQVQTGASAMAIFITVVFFMLIGFMSFNIAAIDGARYLEKFWVLNLFLTVGLHFIFITLVILLLIFSPSVLEPVLFAISIP